MKKNEPILSGVRGKRRPHKGAGRRQKVLYLSRWVPSYAWQRITRHRPAAKTHLIFALADHFEPAIVPEDGVARESYEEQERRLERWCREYPKIFAAWRDADGRPLVHTYFYPAEQYDRALIARLAEHCRSGWGEIEIHLHHGMETPDTPENTRRLLAEFRDRLSRDHGCLSYWNGCGGPSYGFVHGNFALANSDDGRACGVDSEMQILAETGCYADFTLPTAAFHGAQTGKINSIYECAVPLTKRAPHRKGRDLSAGKPPQIFPLIVQGPLMLDLSGTHGARRLRVDNAALTGANPATLHRLSLWKRAAISVSGKPDWLFIKLHCHGMDPTHEAATLGAPMQNFLCELVSGAKERDEILHFVSAREMTNIILAGCDGKEGNPGDYRDYRLKRKRTSKPELQQHETSAEVLKG